MAVIPFTRIAGPTQVGESVTFPNTPRQAWVGVPTKALAEIARLQAENAELRQRLEKVEALEQAMNAALADLLRACSG